MKKMSQRDQLLLFGMIVVVVLYLFYTYFYVPFEEKITTLKDNRDNLVMEADVKKPEIIDSRVSKLSSELQLHKEEKTQFELERMITREQQDKLLLFIGDKANELGVNLVKFEEKDTNNNSSYNVVGFDIKARGDSKDLVLFMNSIYSFYNYCFITDLNLRKVEIIPTFESMDLGTLTDEEKLRINWNDEQINLILMDIPPFIVDEDVEEKEENKKKKTNEKELQLDFSLYFILSD